MLGLKNNPVSEDFIIAGAAHIYLKLRFKIHIIFTKATPKSVLRLMGLKGLPLYHLKSHLQKYRLGQQQEAKKQNVLDHNTENSGDSYGHHNMRIASTSANSSSMNSEQGDIPIAEALRCQIEVQKTLQQQLEVQKKLQMRIEVEGKYMQSILEKTQHSLSPDIN
ncbi:hypothetical protein MIMGU_mgv1a021476mg, partial [Erythranthe guttata]